MDDEEQQHPHHGYWYRNYAVEIAPGRYDRSGWRLEPQRERQQHVPRSSSGQRVDGRHIVTKPDKLPGPQPKYSPDQLPLMRGLYERIRVERIPNGHSLRVVARCTGAVCGGKLRTFTPIAWAESQPNLRACSKCVGALRKAERQAHRDALRQAGQPAYNMRGRLS